jgi:carbamoyltransferase
MVVNDLVLPHQHNTVPEVVHADGLSAATRPARTDAMFEELLRNLGDLTGTPVVLNTSLNTRAERVVCTPADAFALLLLYWS